MNTKRFPLLSIALLLLASALVSFAAVPAAYAEPQFGQGCQCHNNGIAVWFNGTGFYEFSAVTVAGGGSFHLNATTANYAATGVVPGLQQWMMNLSDTAKFTINPQSVQVSSPQNLSHVKVNTTIAAMYAIQAPQQAGTYKLAFYGEGRTVSVVVLVTGASSTTSSSGSTTSSSGSTTSSSGSTTSSSGSTTSSSGSTTSSSGSQTTTSSNGGATSTTIKALPSTPDVTFYSSELALIVVGFSLFIVVALSRYRKS